MVCPSLVERNYRMQTFRNISRIRSLSVECHARNQLKNCTIQQSLQTFVSIVQLQLLLGMTRNHSILSVRVVLTSRRSLMPRSLSSLSPSFISSFISWCFSDSLCPVLIVLIVCQCVVAVYDFSWNICLMIFILMDNGNSPPAPHGISMRGWTGN